MRKSIKLNGENKPNLSAMTVRKTNKSTTDCLQISNAESETNYLHLLYDRLTNKSQPPGSIMGEKFKLNLDLYANKHNIASAALTNQGNKTSTASTQGTTTFNGAQNFTKVTEYQLGSLLGQGNYA